MSKKARATRAAGTAARRFSEEFRDLGQPQKSANFYDSQLFFIQWVM
jgi:hypothetical protein